MESSLVLIVGLLSLIVGGLIGFLLFKMTLKVEYENAKRKAQEEISQKLYLEHQKKEESLLKKIEEVNEREKHLTEEKMRLAHEKEKLEKEILEIQKKKKEIDDLKLEAEKNLKDAENYKNEYIVKLQESTKLSLEEAQKALFQEIKEQTIVRYEKKLKEIIEDFKERENEIVRKLVVETAQRIGAETTSAHSIIYVNLNSDAEKGKIIGREGRNINTFESLTGVDIIIDDTPEMIGISCHDPYKREIARIALQMLIADGRIHPATIEQAVEKAQKKIDEEIILNGRRAITELGIGRMHPELVKYVGKMYFRTSYEQNLLKHSIEVAKLCGVLAAELKLDPKISKRAGLLHDIGKVVEDQLDKPHAIVGMEIARKYGESFEVCNAIGSHHNDIEMQVIYAPIVQLCDAISGARPGARRETSELYLQRIESLEQIAMSFSDKGVEKCYVIQGGRELRVILSMDKTTDRDVDVLADLISRKIEESINFPGQIKVVVIREYKKVSIAK